MELIARLRTIAPEHAEIGRVGREEFTVVLPRMELQTAVALAERMRNQVAATPFATPAGSTVTASFGVSYTPAGGTFSDAYGRADEALYEAKRRGRNALVFRSWPKPLLFEPGYLDRYVRT